MTKDDDVIGRVTEPAAWLVEWRFAATTYNAVPGGGSTILRNRASLDQKLADLNALGFVDAIRVTPWYALPEALLSRLTQAEGERDEAIKDRNAHAEHVRHMARECEDGLAALEMIDRCWEACGYPTNRRLVTLEEQILSMVHQINEPEALASTSEPLTVPEGNSSSVAESAASVASDLTARDAQKKSEGGE